MTCQRFFLTLFLIPLLMDALSSEERPVSPSVLERNLHEISRGAVPSALQTGGHPALKLVSDIDNIGDADLSFFLSMTKNLYQLSTERAVQAQKKERTCQRRLNNVKEVIAVLNEVVLLYEKAAELARYNLDRLIDRSILIQDQEVLKRDIETYQGLAEKYKQEASLWPASVAAQRANLKEQLGTLREDAKLLGEKGLKRSCCTLQKQALSLLEQLVEGGKDSEIVALNQELEQLKISIAAFEEEADRARLTKSTSILSREESQLLEKEKKELFFKSDFLLQPDHFLSNIFKNILLPRAIPLDGQTEKKENEFALFTDQFYSFLVQNGSPVSDIFIKVYENEQLVHVEQISLPIQNTQGWERYLKEGMLFVPETHLKSGFGFDLRFSFVCDPKTAFSMIVTQKSTHPQYRFAISIDPEIPLYACQFALPPPWQLDSLRKPVLFKAHSPVEKLSHLITLNFTEEGKQRTLTVEGGDIPILDQLVEELKRDPLAIAEYVQNEIALVDPHLRQEDGILQAPGIQRDPCATYLEGHGSPWEQCLLLVYLLRKAGYQAVYFLSDDCYSLPKEYVGRMLSAEFSEESQEVRLKYPGVIFCDGENWISLFPWMKEVDIRGGHDLYRFLPEEYASSHRWILRYLKGDENILQHIGPDGDDTAGVLFVRFVEAELRRQGLFLNDVGIHRVQLKKQFASWEDFPRPKLPKLSAKILTSQNEISELFALAKVEICSHENPNKAISCTLPLFLLNQGSSFIHFSPLENNCCRMELKIPGEKNIPLELDASDRIVDVKIVCQVPVSAETCFSTQTFSMAKGTTAALCCHFGGDSPRKASYFYRQFSEEKDEEKRLALLLSFVGAVYFEKCSRAEKALADLHQIKSTLVFAFGLSKLSPDPKKGPYQSDEDLIVPQVDMIWFHSPTVHSSVGELEQYTAHTQYKSLVTVDASSNEHQILKEVFKDLYAISTVRLLQLAHEYGQKKGTEAEGFLIFTTASVEAAEQTPEAAQGLYFSHLKDLNLRDVKTASPAQWSALKNLLDSNAPFSSWSYAYMTPEQTWSQNGSHLEMAALIFSPYTQYALISSNNLIFHGGLGSSLPSSCLTPQAIREWKLVPVMGSSSGSYALQFPSTLVVPQEMGKKELSADVRPWYKTAWDVASDPVDIVTGAFYIDETDLALPAPFSLSIRRNYNSQNPMMSDLGWGWKLSLNPFLVDQEGKRFAAELDGTVIVYSYNAQTDRWEVLPENNPELSNFNQQGIGGSASPFHSYIEKDILYGADGSKRFFENGLLQKWVDAQGKALSFFYDSGRLCRIESSYGDFFGIHYNHEGNLSEIYAKDGRRISYNYNSQGDLIKVTLPNTAEINYEYDRNHRVIRETKPHGKVLENEYDDAGRVTQQKSPMGVQQAMVITATFEYAKGKTIVTDAEGGKTIYHIFDQRIYKIIDPLGFITLQAWFIDKESWLNPETGKVARWNRKGGAARSLKSTTDKRGLTTSYLYDARGNLESIRLEGKDLTGSGESEVVKQFSYNDLNLSISEEACGQKTLTTYDSTFPHLPKRVEKFVGKALISYIDFSYNLLGQLEREDHSGSLTLWKYNDQGLPCEKTQVTGTEDPNVTTTYAYNRQGQCIASTARDGTHICDYDLMGNQILSKLISSEGKLLSALYVGYDLNNAPIWRQTANAENVLYLDYHASGMIKAKRQSLFPSRLTAYTLYEYDSRGYLTEETDPRGYTTYRDYDALGRITSETKEGRRTFFSYEPGGLVETMTSASCAQTTRRYTTNGLLKEETHPDGTKDTIIYDLLGRPILESRNGIEWEIKYDDAHHRIIKTHVSTQTHEISEFDPRGNLIRVTDAAGYTLEKTYDGLGRIKTATTPSGKQTLWRYEDNRVICTLPSGETTTTHYAQGRAIKSKVVDSQGTLIAVSQLCFDPEHESEEVIEGTERTTTWKNSLGLPIKVEKGGIVSHYEYDACGNCTLSIDADGRVTRQIFDGLGRLVQKELEGGNSVACVYDLDSNLIEYHLPNGNIWKASYNNMQRKQSEELLSKEGSSGHWTFSYENGYLKEAVDPNQRTHIYTYDSYGKLIQEAVEGSQRLYTYDPRGLLVAAEQVTESPSSWPFSWLYGSQGEHSRIERSYDPDGNLSLELIYLNSQLIQQTQQIWAPAGRSLQIGSHTRNFRYQNNQLVHVSTPHAEFAYSYDQSSSLKGKQNRFLSQETSYNVSGLPSTITTHLPERTYLEQLNWYPSGKLATYAAPGAQQAFSYNEQGYLTQAGSEQYTFDFASAGTGVLTATPHWQVPLEDGLDATSRILTSESEKGLLSTDYNAMGEVISQGQRQFTWDPWGRLLQVTDPSFSWEASYDAFGRRLQTRYTKSGEQPLTTQSFYDPEEEFQEIGVQIGNKTFWKIYGPNACDAVCDETGASVTLVHNALRQLIGVVTPQGTSSSNALLSAYGPLETAPTTPTDLISYAQSLNWHSKAQDPTGLIWMGDRYYDPTAGQFLSQDPLAHPLCLNLYSYANGDPINYLDLDGRFASHAYRNIAPAFIGAWQPLAMQGSNAFAAQLANRQLTKSMSFEVGNFNLPNGLALLINGINNTKEESMQSALRLSQYAQGAKIHGIYNATNVRDNKPLSICIDVLECIAGHIGFHTPPVQLLKNAWARFMLTHGPDAKVFQTCHSGGADHVKNALLSSSESVRQRIIVLAIAPSVIIPSKLCFRSFNYISRRDFVTHLDLWGKMRYSNELRILEPHPDADLWDHGFLSPTFEKRIREHLQEYIEDYGGEG